MLQPQYVFPPTLLPTTSTVSTLPTTTNATSLTISQHQSQQPTPQIFTTQSEIITNPINPATSQPDQ